MSVRNKNINQETDANTDGNTIKGYQNNSIYFWNSQANMDN